MSRLSRRRFLSLLGSAAVVASVAPIVAAPTPGLYVGSVRSDPMLIFITGRGTGSAVSTLYDVFVWNDAGTLRLTRAPAYGPPPLA